MANDGKRTFVHAKAQRVATPAMIGLVGPSGSGKTRSALRLATGLQRVVGGDIWMIDTEAKRGLHHADKFNFTHLPFGAPFSPLDYLGAFEHCIKSGARHIIVDSMSHEHEGPGGVLEMHAQEVEARAEAEARRFNKERTSWGDEKHNFPAWAVPKAQRRQMINFILQQECNFVFCFRAKQKIKMVKSKDKDGRTKTEMVEQGFQAIAGEEFLYEMLINFLLLPGAKGLPAYRSEYPGESELIKVPEQFFSLAQKPSQLSEDIGDVIGRWCAGGAAAAAKQTASEPPPAGVKKPVKAEPKPDALLFHRSYANLAGTAIEDAPLSDRNEYIGWLKEIADDPARSKQRADIVKHLEAVEELSLRIEAERQMDAERGESAA